MEKIIFIAPNRERLEIVETSERMERKVPR
jgi:hypothetical protein